MHIVEAETSLKYEQALNSGRSGGPLLKIAHLVTHFPQLSETFILNRITGQIDRGLDPQIYARPPAKAESPHQDVDRYQLLERTHHCPPMAPRAFPRALEGIVHGLKNFPRAPIPILRCLDVLRYGERAASLNLLYMALPFLRERPRFDVIHCHYGPIGQLGVALREMGLVKGKIVTSFYGYDVTRQPLLRNPQVYHRLFAQGERVLALSEHMKSQLVALGCPPERVLVHHLGVDCQRFAFRERQAHDKPLEILSIARLVEKKGLEYAIEALAWLQGRDVSFRFRVVGDGPLASQLQRRTAELGLSDNVEFLGWRKQDEVAELLDTTDLLLAPSVRARDGDEEGTPTVIVEAMARGVPVLATRHSGIPEMVRDGETGFLVPERDAEALFERLVYFDANRDQWSGWSSRGRQVIEEEFDVHRLNDQLLEIYEGLS